MPERDRIAVGFTILAALLGALAVLVPWIILPAALLAVFLFFWGRKSQRTEEAVSRVPILGQALSRWLHQFDLIITPREEEYEQHLRQKIGAYEPQYRKSLRQLWETRAPLTISGVHWERFKTDGLVNWSHGTLGSIKTEIRGAVDRILRDLES